MFGSRAVRRALTMLGTTAAFLVALAAASAGAWPPLERTFGAPGAGAGQFQASIDAIAVAPSGDIYVADSVPGAGAGAGVLAGPRTQTRIQHFAPDGSYLGSWSPQLPLGADTVWVAELAVSPTGTLYAAVAISSLHPLSGRVDAYARDGTLESSFSPSGGVYASGVAVAPGGDVYVSECYASRVERFSAAGTFVSSWGSKGHGDGQLVCPQGIAIDGAGRVYVIDYSTVNNRIEVFTADGGAVGTWANHVGVFQGIATDSAGRLLLSLAWPQYGAPADVTSLRAVALAPDGSLADELDSPPGPPQNAQGPIASGPGGEILLADERDSDVMVFAPATSPSSGGQPTGGSKPTASSPVISSLSVRPARFRVPRGRASTRTTFRWRLSKAARMRISITKRHGRQVVAVATLSAHSATRAASLRFNGRVKGKRLASGSYRATATAQDSAGRLSKSRSVTFTVVR